MVRFGRLEAIDDLQRNDFIRVAVHRNLMRKLEVMHINKCVYKNIYSYTVSSPAWGLLSVLCTTVLEVPSVKNSEEFWDFGIIGWQVSLPQLDGCWQKT